MRRLWRRLISMRTAIVLLFLLALASVPGSLLPQRPLNAGAVDEYIASHGGWGRFLDRLGMYDVFGTVWFAAIYLLLFVSLIGCLIPRIKVHARAARSRPLPAPKNLARLAESGRFETADEPQQAADAMRAALGRRWRVERRAEPAGVVTLSAEKGYLRETGNLVFHLGLLVALALVAIGRLYSYEGSVIVSEGSGFCNTVISYDSWRPGRLAAQGTVQPAPFCIDKLDDFEADYLPDGQASSFRADVTFSRGVSGNPEKATIRVNHPLRLEGDRVYLIGHGYTPHITVRMPDGSVIKDQMAFVPSEQATLFSEGAFKLTGKPGAKQDIGIEGYFAPTPHKDSHGIVRSLSPEVKDPMLGVFVWLGELNTTGRPQSVYSLDTEGMTKIGAADLQVGQTARLPGGVTVTFDGWSEWASMQVSHDPAQQWLVIVTVLMIAGLLGSLAVRRRRVWLRISPAVDGSPTVVAVGGLARNDSGNFSAEFAALLERLSAAARPVVPELQLTKES